MHGSFKHRFADGCVFILLSVCLSVCVGESHGHLFGCLSRALVSKCQANIFQSVCGIYLKQLLSVTIPVEFDMAIVSNKTENVTISISKLICDITCKNKMSFLLQLPVA